MRPDGFILYGKLGIDLFTIWQMLYPHMKVRIRLYRATPSFYMKSKNPNVSFSRFHWNSSNLASDAQNRLSQKRVAQIAYAPVEYNHMETIAKTHIFLARQNQFIQENIFNNAKHQIAIAMNSNSAFTGSFAKNPFWYQQFNLRDLRVLRGGQQNVSHHTTDSCRLYVTTMKAMNFQDDIPSIPIDNFTDHHVLVIDLNSMQDATEHWHYPEIFVEQLRLELYSVHH